MPTKWITTAASIGRNLFVRSIASTLIFFMCKDLQWAYIDCVPSQAYELMFKVPNWSCRVWCKVWMLFTTETSRFGVYIRWLKCYMSDARTHALTVNIWLAFLDCSGTSRFGVYINCWKCYMSDAQINREYLIGFPRLLVAVCCHLNSCSPAVRQWLAARAAI